MQKAKNCAKWGGNSAVDEDFAEDFSMLSIKLSKDLTISLLVVPMA